MIVSFAHRGLRQFWQTGTSHRINPDWHGRVTLQLDALNASTEPEDMNLAGWDFHGLKGQKKKELPKYAVSVSGNWRITWEWDTGDAYRVNLEDYH